MINPLNGEFSHAGAPIMAFALQRITFGMRHQKRLFRATNLKKADVQKFPKLGNIPGSDVTCITVDQSGKVWFGGKNGIAVQNGATFTNYTTENGLPDLNVNAIAVANDGSVWVGTDNGAAVFQGNQWKVYNQC